MQNSSIQAANIVTWAISLLALGIASFSLYLQRRDRRPRLNIRLEYGEQELEFENEDDLVPVWGSPITLLIHAANPTEKQIIIDSINFKRAGHDLVKTPLSRIISAIPAHEKRHAEVMVDLLKEELGGPVKGHVVLIDALGYHHASKTISIF
jgi:hypothetical protein